VEGIKGGEFKRIVCMTGAGISVSAGIPDFRSPGTGIYDNLKEYNLDSPQDLFSLPFFKKNPQPFVTFVKNFDMEGVVPTSTHYFVRLLQDKGLLHKYLTQNIDDLESIAGISDDIMF